MRRGSARTEVIVVNFTNGSVSASLQSHTSATFLDSRSAANIGELSVGSITILTLVTCIKDEESDRVKQYDLSSRISGGRKWELLDPKCELWRVYRVKIKKGQHKIVILENRPLASWMRDLSDSLSLADLCLPGTHETMALYGWPFSQCQDITLAEQLTSGIRMIDIRIILYKGELVAFHGATPERATFTSILDAVCSFIRSPEGRHETVIMSIMEEDSFLPSSPLFSQLVHDAIFSTPSDRKLWYLENRIPTLGEVRGKIILFSRFGKDGKGWEGGLNGIGIHPPIWPDSRREGFEWEMGNARVRVQDWYAIPSFLSIPEKAQAAVEMLHPKPAPDGKQDLAITFMSAARVPFALPSTVACGFGWSQFMLGVEGVNSRVGRWLLQQLAGDEEGAGRMQVKCPKLERGDTQETLVGVEDGELIVPKHKRKDLQNGVRLRGWVLIDFIQDPHELSVIPLLLEFNDFRNGSGIGNK